MSRQSELAELGRVYATTPLSNRNLIINGAMQVAQRGTSAQLTGSNIAYKTVDRWINYGAAYSTLVTTQSQSTDVPSGSGFIKSFNVTVDTAEAAPAGGFLDVRHKIENQDMQRFAFGTSSAKSMTLSFWVKSTVTGTYNVAFYINDSNKVTNATYTINSADTWEYKTITVSGHTVSGEGFGTNNAVGFYVSFTLSAGTNYKGSPFTGTWGTYTSNTWGGSQTADVAATASNYWRITGVQLEAGDTATPFEHRSYGDELLKCQRYFHKNGAAAQQYYAKQYTSSHKFVDIQHPVQMRAAPAVSFTMSGGSWTTYLHDEVHWKAYGSSSYTDTGTYRLQGYSFDAEL